MLYPIYVDDHFGHFPTKEHLNEQIFLTLETDSEACVVQLEKLLGTLKKSKPNRHHYGILVQYQKQIAEQDRQHRINVFNRESVSQAINLIKLLKQ